MVCLNTQFHIPDSSTSLLFAIISKAKQNLYMATMLLFYIPHEYYIKKRLIKYIFYVKFVALSSTFIIITM